MKTKRCFEFLLAAIMLPAGPNFLAAQSWVGEIVIPIKPTEKIQFGDVVQGQQVKFTLAPYAGFQVRGVREDRICIYDGHREGWCDKNDFVLARDAPAYFNRIIQTQPNNSFAWNMRGVGWMEKGELDKAVKDFNEAIRLDPTESHYYANRGHTLLGKKEYDKAIQDYNEAIRLDPSFSLTFTKRGIAWFYKREYDKAIQDYNVAIRLDPTYTLSFNTRGLAWFQKKEYDKAIQDYNEAIRLDSKFTEAFYNRGLAWFCKKEYDRAIQNFNKCIHLDPKDTYPPIFAYFAACQVKKAAIAKQFLHDSLVKLNKTAWPFPVIRFLSAEIDEPALLALATDNDKMTEARCFLGLYHAIKENKDKALTNFRWVKEQGNIDCYEYSIALNVLEQLERSPGTDKR